MPEYDYGDGRGVVPVSQTDYVSAVYHDNLEYPRPLSISDASYYCRESLSPLTAPLLSNGRPGSISDIIMDTYGPGFMVENTQILTFGSRWLVGWIDI